MSLEPPPGAQVMLHRYAGPAPGGPGEVCVARVAGAFDIAAAETLRPHCDAEALRGCRLLIVDLCRADFLDSEGIKLLLEIRHRLLEQEGDLLVLAQEGGNVLRTLQLSGCWRLIPILKTVGEALPVVLRGYCPTSWNGSFS